MRTKTKIIRVIENIHMPTVIKSLPNWINNSNSKIDDGGTSTSSSSSTSSLTSNSSSTFSSKQKQKTKSKLKLNNSKLKPTKITTIENLNAPSKFNTTSEISSKYSKDFISKAFIDTFSNKLSTEKRTIVLDELLHKCSPEELYLLKVLIDKNLSESTTPKNRSEDIITNKHQKKYRKEEIKNNDKKIYSFNTSNISNTIYDRKKNASLIKDNDYQFIFKPLTNKPDMEIENVITSYNNKHNRETIININRNQSKSPLNNYINNNNNNSNNNNNNNNNRNGKNSTLANIPFSSKNSNETLINESTTSYLLNHHQYLAPSDNILSSFHPVQTSYNDLYNYRNTNSFDYSPINTKSIFNASFINNTWMNSNKKIGSLFDKLADELLIHIFSYLDTQSLAYASQVNCRWYSLLRGNKIKK
ncbi:hypothetical protein PIROE2DRAFT_4192 [Piromyces sp. E2]|nr:hypothetical protein PIROE2DRAFT_4192 [Piromyces sp. E2]|eukprot:OUM68188.1 hypothetical protein PIROE2DRAFT_4192 [Piromyces sp. E2]